MHDNARRETRHGGGDGEPIVDWLAAEESRAVGWTREGADEAVGHRWWIVEIARKRMADLTEDDNPT